MGDGACTRLGFEVTTSHDCIFKSEYCLTDILLCDMLAIVIVV